VTVAALEVLRDLRERWREVRSRFHVEVDVDVDVALRG
jgi:hypothetical protein